MEPYDVCVMTGEDPLILRFYTSEEAYKDFNPSKIYVIAYKNLREARKMYRYLGQAYDKAEVKLLREDRDKDIIDIVVEYCYEV
jgi:predicted lipid-binding transport protein (Tim44 family)